MNRFVFADILHNFVFCFTNFLREDIFVFKFTEHFRSGNIIHQILEMCKDSVIWNIYKKFVKYLKKHVYITYNFYFIYQVFFSLQILYLLVISMSGACLVGSVVSDSLQPYGPCRGVLKSPLWFESFYSFFRCIFP